MVDACKNDGPPGSGIDFGPACLVTGSAGFLGTALVRALAARGCRVHAFDRRRTFTRDERVKVFTGDIRDYRAVLRAAEGVSTVFHTAAVLNFLGICSSAVRREVFDINYIGTCHVIEACRAADVRRLVHTSTDSVCYSPGPLTDADETRPYSDRFIDVYAESKVAAERAALAADGTGGLRSVAIRPAGLWGPGPGCYMTSRLVRELAAGNLVATVGDGKSLADNTHVSNLVHAEFLAAEKLVEDPDVAGGQAYFVTDGEPMNIMEWFRPLIEELGYSIPTRRVPASVMVAAAWLMEWLHLLGGPRPMITRLEVHNMTTSFTFRCDKARRELGYEPLIGQAEGMKHCVPYCRELLAVEKRGRKG